MHPCETYLDSTYLAKTGGTWHLEDAPFKASQVLRMLRRNPAIQPKRVCDVGCGAGGVLLELERLLPETVKFTGFEISPQAHALSLRLGVSRSEFALGDPFESDEKFDLALVLDVVEHVEDIFAFLRQCSHKAKWKMYHIPLEANASMILRGVNCWDSVSHLHLFTIETAIKSVQHADQNVIDWFLTPSALERPNRAAARLMNVPRRMLPERLAARLVGGYSIMILAR